MIEDLLRFDVPVPRYTSYPTAPQFAPQQPPFALEHLARLSSPCSLYIHIPFCRSMCLFCGCSVVLNRRPERQARYLDALASEIALVAAAAPLKRSVAQLHFGGGTPTSLSLAEMEELLATLSRHFPFTPGAERSIEVDPRTVFEDRGEKLRALFRLGFNRISFGVQDLDPAVQEAVRRRQSEETSLFTLRLAQELGFSGINVDLIYGLPLQTVSSFRLTARTIGAARPDRIALFSYAKVPWLKPHQKAIPDESLPSTREKFEIYLAAREAFLEAGYVQIGMDHFALPTDELARLPLTRNFQGYAAAKSQDLIGLGLSAIGSIGGAYTERGSNVGFGAGSAPTFEPRSVYLQNTKDLVAYERALAQGCLPIERGKRLTLDDEIRRYVIHTLMCDFSLDKRLFNERFGFPFDAYFRAERLRLLPELLEESPTHLAATPLGRLFIRVAVSPFDAYLQRGGQFSKGV
jgi:oxygen-independent coproporphyrinogen-3 oxidase